MKKVLLLFIVCIVTGFAGLNYFLPVPDDIKYSTIITDSRGDVIHGYLTSDEKWRMNTSLSEISPLLQRTIIEKEDRHFYHHFGIDPFSMVRAFALNLLRRRRTSGASTITMQVARSLEHRPRTYAGKFVEMFRAIQLEIKYSKAEILRMYCNLLPYGGNIEGMKSASLLYFGKDPDHLSLAEITALCVIPNRPSTLVPGKNNAAICEERNRWLRKFAANHVFSQKEIADALQEPFTATRRSLPRFAPHLAERLHRDEVPQVHSSIVLSTQVQTEKIIAAYSRELKLKGITNAAAIVVDNRSHKVVAYVGSADFHDSVSGGQNDGATAVREPGSTLKPLLYGMCIDGGFMTPATVITDVAVNYDGYTPENFNKKLNGYVSMQYALEHSLNIPAVRTLNRFGKEKFVSALSACGFRSIQKDRGKLGLSVILGGCGATLLELAGAYSAIANGGEYTQLSLTAGDGPTRRFRMMSPAAAYMISDILSRVARPDFPLSWQSTEHMPRIAWKTGTSYGRRDAWSIGYNKRFTVAVWTGNFSGRGASALTGSEIATPLLFRIFNMIDYDKDEDWFAQPEECQVRMVCPETGMLPSADCPPPVSDYFIPSISQAALCNNRQTIMISADEKISYCRTCAPAAGYKTKLFRVIAPEMEAYYDDSHIAYEKIPPHNPDCPRIFKDQKPLIISPRGGAEYLLSRKNPQPIQLRCRPGSDVSRISWYVNNRFYQLSESGASVFFIPPEGPVKISCSDDKGRNRDIWINVRFADL